MKNYGIVLAAGKGKRMGSKISKQFLDLNGKPLFFYALEAFENSDVDSVIVVCSAEYKDYCENVLSIYKEEKTFSKVEKIVVGGAERYNSVYNALKEISDADYVLIHDGARPMITKDIINRSLTEVKKHKACVVAVPVKDTIKEADSEDYINKTLDRSSLWQMQTPQSFEYKLIAQAYENAMKSDLSAITDDAMVLEMYNPSFKIKLVMGDYKNLKVTTSEDLEIAKVFLKS